ncbi:related to TAM domain methyltransferase [Cephalotrichum gorgonifer]|uniref:Related to TAM domain methyltransferase n=1 Tax=Cephalotrichum gorgonifer TaxID=2041049 RepID=A0AAE8MZN3_9PEZI|nr:related to TAM domain methyltransferase [Cephalotrichum gorgonifer]
MTDETTPAASPPGPQSPAKPESPPRSEPVGPGGILPAEHWAQQELVVADDGESALGESVVSSTASITSSVLNYRMLHGRRYHSEIGHASYWGSNDEAQSESLDLNHLAMTLACGQKLYLAPLEEDKVHRALDIGTGTGIWAIDFADEFPKTEVIGTDISPIQPTWVPPLLKFEIEDCTLNWTFAPDSFDYIHMRWLLGSITDWTALFAEAYKACSPGGWVESLEPSCQFQSDHTGIPDDSALGQWGKFFIEGGKKIGQSFTVLEDNIQRKAMEAAGFVDIQEFQFKVPIGPWPKDPQLNELGVLGQAVLESDIEGYILFIANTIGWSRPEIQVYIAHLRREVRFGNHYPYYRAKVVWGRKPDGA